MSELFNYDETYEEFYEAQNTDFPFFHTLIDADVDIGLKEYPIFLESYRGKLNQKIIDHYWYRRLNHADQARFIRGLNTVMNEQMPFYNDLYRSALLIVQPLRNRDYTRTVERTAENTANQTTNQEGTNEQTTGQENLNVHSDTPSALISAANIAGNVYASAADRQANEQTVEGTNTNEQTTASTNTDEESISEIILGLDGMTQSAAIMEFRSTLLNIDLMVINSLAECFMGVF